MGLGWGWRCPKQATVVQNDCSIVVLLILILFILMQYIFCALKKSSWKWAHKLKIIKPKLTTKASNPKIDIFIMKYQANDRGKIVVCKQYTKIYSHPNNQTYKLRVSNAAHKRRLIPSLSHWGMATTILPATWSRSRWPLDVIFLPLIHKNNFQNVINSITEEQGKRVLRTGEHRVIYYLKLKNTRFPKAKIVQPIELTVQMLHTLTVNTVVL